MPWTYGQLKGPLTLNPRAVLHSDASSPAVGASLENPLCYRD